MDIVNSKSTISLQNFKTTYILLYISKNIQIRNFFKIFFANNHKKKFRFQDIIDFYI